MSQLARDPGRQAGANVYRFTVIEQIQAYPNVPVAPLFLLNSFYNLVLPRWF